MQMTIKLEEFLGAIKKLEAKKPIGRGKKAYLSGPMTISIADQTAILQAGGAKVTCAAEGFWVGEVEFPFPIALSLLKVPPKDPFIKLQFENGRLLIGPLKISGRLIR